MALEECCSRCTECGTTVCVDKATNWCPHGDACCADCHPGTCLECAEEVAAS